MPTRQTRAGPRERFPNRWLDALVSFEKIETGGSEAIEIHDQSHAFA